MVMLFSTLFCSGAACRIHPVLLGCRNSKSLVPLGKVVQDGYGGVLW